MGSDSKHICFLNLQLCWTRGQFCHSLSDLEMANGREVHMAMFPYADSTQYSLNNNSLLSKVT